MRSVAVFAFSLVFLLSCTTSGTRIYSLSLPPVKERSNVEPRGSVNIILHAPRYLEQPYVAIRISSYEVELSKDSRWDSSPAIMMRQAIKESLCASGLFAAVKTLAFVPPGFYDCEVNLRRFERFDKGNDSFGELDFEITFRSPKCRLLYNGSISREAKLADRSDSSLVKFLSEALSQGLNEANAAITKSLP
jgi:ABC-type uncharacterized transport system auxiliary subunit